MTVMRAGALWMLVCSACTFHTADSADVDAEAPGSDSALDPDGTPDVDAANTARLCDPAAGLLVCFSFDAAHLQGSLANEGTANVALAVSSIGRIDRGAGGAAMVDTTSQMRIAPNAETMGIVAMEAWVRLDVEPPAGGRVGLVDADATSSAMSFFFYRPSQHQLRFELGQQLFLDYPFTLGTWMYLAQVCDGNVLTAYVDGVKIGEKTGCSPGNGTQYGLQIGQNNNQTGGDEWMTGAIDGVRMWTVPRTAMQICQAAGLASC
jgi:Concanavalin A-like lectin/glucanases superfamily